MPTRYVAITRKLQARRVQKWPGGEYKGLMWPRIGGICRLYHSETISQCTDWTSSPSTTMNMNPTIPTRV